MSSAWVQLLFFTGLFICLTPLFSGHTWQMFLLGKQPSPTEFIGWLENLCYRIGGTNPKEEMSWVEYGKALLLFNFLGFITLFFLQLLQGYLPLNPQNLGATSWPLAYNIAMSFTTNTNWQSYAGETTLSYLTQMLGLTSHNFLSAATGMAALLTLTRGLIRKTVDTIGNFWVDLVCMVVYILLPLSIIMAVVLVGEGVIQTFSPYMEVTTLENAKQTIPLGPVASQIAIKQLGTNGGGFFNANSAHPFENPNGFFKFLRTAGNCIQFLQPLLITFGNMIGSPKHAWMLLFAMMCPLGRRDCLSLLFGTFI